MQAPDNRARTVVAVILIGLGLIFLAANLLNIDLGRLWPLIFFVIGVGFYLPPMLLPDARAGLAALFIPGTIMNGLGLIFLYNTLTGDWSSWAYLWTLIPGWVGVGLILAAWIGRWEGGTVRAGLVLVLGSALAFGLMAALFGNQIMGTIWPVLLILMGAWLLLRSFRPRRA
jgi:hypothetical protein